MSQLVHLPPHTDGFDFHVEGYWQLRGDAKEPQAVEDALLGFAHLLDARDAVNVSAGGHAAYVLAVACPVTPERADEAAVGLARALADVGLFGAGVVMPDRGFGELQGQLLVPALRGFHGFDAVVEQVQAAWDAPEAEGLVSTGRYTSARRMFDERGAACAGLVDLPDPVL